jgi:thiol-disulfide isomerase/thioredoxin
MKPKLLSLFLLIFCGNLLANNKIETSRIIIKNPSEVDLLIQAEVSPYIVFDNYLTKKKLDTLNIESSGSFRLVFRNADINNQLVYTTFLIKTGERIILDWEVDGVKAYSGNVIRDNELNFFARMQKDIGSFEGLFIIIPHKRKNADSLLFKVQELNHKRLDFLDNYKTTYQISSYFKKVICFRQYYEFLDHCKLDNIFDKSLLVNVKVKNFLAPLSSIVSSDIYFLEALGLAELLSKSEEDDISSYYSTLQNKYQFETQDYLLYKAIEMANRSTELGNLVDNYLTISNSDLLKKYVLDKYGDFIGKGLEISKPVYDYSKESLLYNLKTGKLTTWDSLLLQDGVKYIDFWATWCGGCRVNLPHTRNLAKINKGKGFKVIYISIDDNINAWAKISKKEMLPDVDSFLLIDHKVTFIKKRFNIDLIPRYMIVNLKGEVINANAPHPNFHGLMDEINKALE